jgi:hypothetical protein
MNKWTKPEAIDILTQIRFIRESCDALEEKAKHVLGQSELKLVVDNDPEDWSWHD